MHADKGWKNKSAVSYTDRQNKHNFALMQLKKHIDQYVFSVSN